MNKHGMRGSFGSLLRRGAALALASAMSLSLLPATAWAAGATGAAGSSAPAIGATKVTDNSEFPKIELQLNVVRTEYGTLNGTAELSLRVGPSGVANAAGVTVDSVSFHSLVTNLRFNTKLLTPIDWEWVADLNNIAADPAGSKIELNKDTDGNTFGKYYQVAIPAKKNDLLPVTGAIAQCGIVDETTATANGMTTNVANGTEALLFFKAEAYDQPITLTEMTTLAVVRFKVNNELMKHLSITPSDTKNPDGTYTYTLHSDLLTGADDTVTDMAALNTAIANGVTANALSLTGFETVVGFAADADIEKAEPKRHMALYYSSGANEYYYVPDMSTDKVGTTAAGLATDKQKVSINENGTVTEYDLSYPNTVNTDDMILAVDATKPVGDADRYSYTSNLIPNTNISFTVVSEMSFADKGVDLDKYSVLVFVDWDNTLLGTLVVPKYENVTSLVNEYVKKNLIHPLLKDNTNYTSTARVDTYRGKYIATTPSAETVADATVVDNGEKFPLTNKLDYAFLRRPMERATTTDDSGNIVNTAENTWVQKTATDGTAVYDAKYPYAYGWAKCTADNYTEVWTTLGTTGELNSWDKGDGTTTVASVTSTDSAFQIADLEKGLGKDDSTVFLKAIYEPGDSLLSVNFQYRLCTNPAYNKLTTTAAAAGGAYSVFAQLERATVYEVDSTLRGVTRIREPYIRQETTNDLRWVENTDKGVENDLPNASQSTAEAKTETTYTKVDSANSEVVDINLTLSARQNKVDYYLIDGYNNNFVTGGERSGTNFDRSDSIYTKDNYLKFGQGTANFVVDNYNYYVAGESEERDPDKKFYDVVQFKNINGSHGFVLYGTLNQMMQNATKYYNGEIDFDTFVEYISLEGLGDANLRKTESGDEFTVLDLLETGLPATLKTLAGVVQTNHKDDSNYWDDRLKCARLTYHQIQWYIIEGHLYSPEDADAKHLSFCHLHSDCAATNTDRLDSWDDIITAASSSDTSEQDKIKQLTAAEVEKYTHLRDKNGNPFTTSSDLKEALVRAIKSLSLSGSDATWKNIQYAIMHPAYSAVDGGAGSVFPAAAETATYWWYDGATSAEIGSWSEPDPATGTSLMTALRDATTPVTYPDGTTATTEAKLNNLESAFKGGMDKNAWVKATHNLVTQYDSTTDTPSLEGDFVAFKNDLKAAYTALKSDLNGYEQHDWKLIQFYLLHKSAPTANDAAELDSYWWYDGNFKVKDIESLMRAAANPDGEAWQSFTFADLYTQPGLQFRKSFAGEKYTSEDFDAFKNKVLAYYAESVSTYDWSVLQYHLFYGNLPASNNALKFDANYYWWKDGGEAPTFDLTTTQTKPEDRADALAAALSEAAFRALYNGCEDNLKTALSADVLESGRLVAANNADTFADLTKITDMSVFVETLKNLYATKLPAENTNPVTGLLPTFTWEELQEAVLKAPLPSEDDGGAWWKSADKKPAKKHTPQEDFATLSTLVQEVAEIKHGKKNGELDTAVATLKAFLTVDIAVNIGLVGKDGFNAPTQTELDNIPWADIKYDYKNSGMESKRGAACWGLDNAGTFSWTWYQMQEPILRAGSRVSNADSAESYVTEDMSVTPPEWLTSRASFYATMPATDLTVDSNGMSVVTSVSETELPGGLLLRVETRTVVDLVARTAVTTTVTTLFDANGNILSQSTSSTVTELPADSDDTVYDVDKDTAIITPDAGDGSDNVYKQDKDTTVIAPDQGNDATGNETYKQDKDTEIITPDADDDNSDVDSNTDNGSSGSNNNDVYKNEDDTTLVVTPNHSANKNDSTDTVENDTTLVPNTPNATATEKTPSAAPSPAQNGAEEPSASRNAEQTAVATSVTDVGSARNISPHSLSQNQNDSMTTSANDPSDEQPKNETTTVTLTDTTKTEQDFSGYEIVTVTETPPPVAIAPTLSEPSDEGQDEALPIECPCETPPAPLSLRGATGDAAISRFQFSTTLKFPQIGVNTMTLRSPQRNNGSSMGPLMVSSEQSQTQEITLKGGKAL